MSIIKIATPTVYDTTSRSMDKRIIVLHGESRGDLNDRIGIEIQGADHELDVASITQTDIQTEFSICISTSRQPEPSIRDFIDAMESNLNTHRDAVDDCARELRDEFDRMLGSHMEMDQDFLDRYNREVDKIKKLRWQHMGYENAIEWANNFLKNKTEQK